MTEQTQAASDPAGQIRAVMSGYVDEDTGPKLWLLFDRRLGLFWRPGGVGYTTDLAQAGLFSEAFARRMTGPSYSDRNEEARHLSSFRYMLDEATERARVLAERFALIPPSPAHGAPPDGGEV